MKNTPAIAINSSGNNFATVTTVLSLTPSDTPRRLISDQNVNATTSTSACMPRPDSAGINSPTLAAITDDPAAVANRPIIHSMMPAMNPAYGPRVVPTYAYGPPVNVTR